MMGLTKAQAERLKDKEKAIINKYKTSSTDVNEVQRQGKKILDRIRNGEEAS